MREFIESVIRTGNYKVEDMEARIKRLFLCGDISEQDMSELLEMAAENAKDSAQFDLYETISDLSRRVDALESKGVTVWTSATNITARGQIRLYDIDGDGTLDYVRYDGGRSSTSLSPGKIEGWVKLDASGNVTHKIVRVDGRITLEPIGK